MRNLTTVGQGSKVLREPLGVGDIVGVSEKDAVDPAKSFQAVYERGHELW